MRNKAVRYMDGGTSSGPKSDQGRIRCAQSRTIHGDQTEQVDAAGKLHGKWLKH
jgi:hypothetical protein